MNTYQIIESNVIPISKATRYCEMFRPGNSGYPNCSPHPLLWKVLFGKKTKKNTIFNELIFLRVISRVMAGREDTAALGRYPSGGACAAQVELLLV